MPRTHVDELRDVGVPADPVVRGRQHLHQGLDLVAVHRCEREVEVRRPEPRATGPHRGERAVGVHVGAVRAEYEELAPFRPQHVPQQGDRVLTGPVEVLDHHDPRAVRVGEHVGHGVEQAGPTGARLGGRRRLGQDRGECRGQAGELGQHHGWRRRDLARVDHRPHELRERLVRVAVGEALALDHLGIGVIGDEPTHDRRLADPGDARHVHELRPAALRGQVAGLELPPLVLASDDRIPSPTLRAPHRDDGRSVGRERLGLHHDRLGELHQRVARSQPALGERLLHPREQVERVDLAVGAEVAEHEARGEVFALRALGDDRRQDPHHLVLDALVQQATGVAVHRVEPLLGELRAYRPEHVERREVRVGVAAPLGQGALEVLERLGGLTRARELACARGVFGEAGRVERVARDLQAVPAVAGRAGREHLGATRQGLAEVVDVDPGRVHRLLAVVGVGPERVGEHLGWHAFRMTAREEREHGPAAGPPDRDRAAVLHDRQGAEHADLHACPTSCSAGVTGVPGELAPC